jgi:hypothetical protein
LKKWADYETDGYDDKRSTMSGVARPSSVHSSSRKSFNADSRKSVDSVNRRISEYPPSIPNMGGVHQRPGSMAMPTAFTPASPAMGVSQQRPGSMAVPHAYNNQIPNNNPGNRNSRGSGMFSETASNRMSMMSMGSYSSAPFVAPGMGVVNSAIPPDDEILFHIRRILATANLMTVTKKNVREELSGLFGCDLSVKKAYINSCIDDILARG